MAQNLLSQELKNRSAPNHTTVFLSPVYHFKWLTAGVTCCMVIIGFVLCLGHHTEHYHLRGYVNAQGGVLAIFPTQTGEVQKILVAQGQYVSKGAALFVVGAPNQASDSIKMIKHFDKKKQALDHEIYYKKEQLSKLKSLLDKKLLSRDFYHHQQHLLKQLKIKERALNLEKINYQHGLVSLIRAPISGTISNLIVHKGQLAHINKPLAQLIPNSSCLIVELLVPVRQAGFLKNKTPLKVHIDAYPYAQFGSLNAQIFEIAQSSLTDNEEVKPLSIGASYYKVKARLERQYLTAYKRRWRIRPGMTVASIQDGARKPLWHWFVAR